MNFNLVVVAGRTCRNSELKYLPSGMAVCDNCVAVNSKTKDKEYTEYINITLFGRQAEVFCEYMKKGDEGLFQGKWRTESWEKDGQKHSRCKVVVDSFQMGSKKSSVARSEMPKTDSNPIEENTSSDDLEAVPF